MNELENIYGNEYELNTSGNEEHIFYTKEGPISRSLVYFNWIKPFLFNDFNTLVEVGCGEGRVLERIVNTFPHRNIIGFDGSHRAVELGRRKGLAISQKIIHNNDRLPKADIYLLLGVLEHVENIENFLSSVISALNENGRIIICVPIQDYGGYDIFFVDHVWHFTVIQFECLLRKFNLKLVYSDHKHPINYGFGLFVCEKGMANDYHVVNGSEIMRSNLSCWIERFSAINEWFAEHTFEKIAVFGASEIFSLFMAYSSLSEQNIIACIDDTKIPGDKKHGITIYNSDWLKKNPVDLLLLAVNKKYHGIIRDKCKDFKLTILPIYN